MATDQIYEGDSAMTDPSLATSGTGDGDLSTRGMSEARQIGVERSVPAVSLYRRYRPQSFDDQEMVGQDHIVRTLRNAILLNRVAHAYLFSGPRGTGKTTTARLLAKAINCLDPDPTMRPCNRCRSCIAINAGAAPDIVEIDAASNRGIDDIRDLRERVQYAPAQLAAKVYIIDEAHQITGAAANAFLKTLEEPPAHTRFILATTDPEELLPTIVSRCQRFEFRRIAVDDMVRRLQVVADRERIAIETDALRAIARHATGSLRDALGMLDLLATESSSALESDSRVPIRIDDVQAALGLSRNDRVESLVAALASRQAGAALQIVQESIDAGEDPRQLNKQLLAYLRLLLHERSGGLSGADDRARMLAKEFSLDQLAAHARRFGEIDVTIKHAPYPQLPLEVALVEASSSAVESTEAASEASARSTPLLAEQQSNGSPRVSLRERVRQPAAANEQAEREPPPVPLTRPATITPIRTGLPQPVQSPTADDATRVESVERVVDLWPHVRADVKVLNRRMEALLSEVDPVDVSGNLITLAVPYPFHRDKLNTDDVRDTISGVLSRHLGRGIEISCVLRGEVPRFPRPDVASTDPPQATQDERPTGQLEDEEARALARLQAAKNIFDAEEIEPIALELTATSESDAQ